MKNNTGYTIIEVVAAMAILTIGILALVKLQISSMNLNTSARIQTKATILAAQWIERLMVLPDDHPDLVPAKHRVLTSRGGDHAFEIEWTVTSHGKPAGLKEIRVSATHKGRERKPVSIRVYRAKDG